MGPYPSLQRLLVLLLVAIPAGPSLADAGFRRRTEIPEPGDSAARIPLVLEENRGQDPAGARFLVRGGSWTANLSPRGATYAVGDGTIRMEFLGSAADARLEGAGEPRGRTHWLVGADPEKWIRGIPQYQCADAHGLYPGVRLRWSVAGDILAYDLHLEPGADPDRIALAFPGAASVSVDGRGDLVLRSPTGTVKQSRPVAWQEVADGRRPVAARWSVDGTGRATFRLGARDPALPLVIDPKHTFTTYAGTGSFSRALTPKGAALGQDSTIFVGGESRNLSGPTTRNGFISKYAPDGSGIAFTTFFGTGEIRMWALAVGSDGASYATGYCNPGDLVSTNAFQPAGAGSREAWVVRLKPDGSGFDYASYLGGSSDDYGHAIAVDGSGAAYVAGYTFSSNFPLKGALQGTHAGPTDGFVAKVSPAGTSLAYSTYLGGAGTDVVNGISVGSDGSAYLAGYTSATDFPTQSPVQSTLAGAIDAFYAKLAPSGSALAFSTYLGGTGIDIAYAIGVDAQGAASLTGSTYSLDFPAASAIYPNHRGGGLDAFLTRYSADGSALAYSTYLGGAGSDTGYGIAVDGRGTAWVTGQTYSGDFPTTFDAILTAHSVGGDADGFISQVASDGSFLKYSTFIGGSGGDTGYAAAANSANVVIVGDSSSSNLPMKNAVQAVLREGGFVVGYSLSPQMPLNLTGDNSLGNSCVLRWTDASNDETGFEIQRRTGQGPWAALGSMPAAAISYNDFPLANSTVYGYRVRALGNDGDSPWTPEFSVLTPPPPPAAPSGLTVQSISGTKASLSWTDNSGDEFGFRVMRKSPGASFVTEKDVVANVTTHFSTGLLPGRTYSWRVQARGQALHSPFTSEVQLTLPHTVDITLAKGASTDSAKPGKDKFSVSGTWAFTGEAEDDGLNPLLDGVEFRLGPSGTAPLLVVAGSDAAWRVRGAKATWKSPKGQVPKAVLTVDATARTFVLKLSKFDLPIAPTSPVLLWIASGNDGGDSESEWTVKKPGVLKFP